MTRTAAVRLDGVGAGLDFDGATNAIGFEAYGERALVPARRPGDIGVMDNLAAHNREAVAELIRSAGAEVRHLPAYSPDLRPIEEMFGALKALVRTAAARTVDGMVEAMGVALRAMPREDFEGWFRSCAYCYVHA